MAGRARSADLPNSAQRVLASWISPRRARSRASSAGRGTSSRTSSSSGGLYKGAKRLAVAKEISLAEPARRGLELVLAQAPAPEEIEGKWRPPTVSGLGWKGLTHDEIRDAAQRTAAEEELEERARTATRV